MPISGSKTFFRFSRACSAVNSAIGDPFWSRAHHVAGEDPTRQVYPTARDGRAAQPSRGARIGHGVESSVMTDRGTLVNDVHAQLNATVVRRILRPASVDDVREAVLKARAAGRVIAIAGGRHAMGGQQFGAELDLLDMTGLDRVLDCDRERGEVEVEAGIMWPALIAWLHTIQDGQPHPWGIIQKQTGADWLTLGGALSSECARSRTWPRPHRGRRGGVHPRRRRRRIATLLTRRECGALPARHRRLRAVRADRVSSPPTRAAAQGPPRGDAAGYRRGRSHARSASGQWPWLRGFPVRDRSRQR